MSTKFQFVLDQFGLQNVQRNYQFGKAPEAAPSEFKPQSIASVKSVGTSLLGTPVFSNLEIEGGSYTSNGKTINFKGFLEKEDKSQIDIALFEIRETKNIVKTAIQGRNGTIKEYISSGDYEISIRGALVSPDQSYPENQVNRLIALCKAPVPLKVYSWFLQQFGIYEIVIESYNMPQRAGFTNTQLFELNCISDTPIDLLTYDER